MITLVVENFKCFQRGEISFADLTVLAGINASGKSSIIQALLLVRDFFNVNEDILQDIVTKKSKPLGLRLKNHHQLDLINSNEILHHHFF